jgi:phosphoribosylanthranilate isomerase
LTPENVAQAIAVVRPASVDVSSGVERDGEKSSGLIEAFIAAVRFSS